MSGHDDSIAEMIPWVANGSATTEERRRVEAHLPTCETCRELVDQALELADPDVEGGDLGGHPPAVILRELVEDPERLQPETRGRIETHLRECAVCRSATEVLADLEPHRESRSAAGGVGLWAWLSGNFLSPAMAAAYLVLLVAGLGWFVLGRLSTRSEPGILPPSIPVPGEMSFRDAPVREAPSILIDLSAPDRLVHLTLETDIDASDLSDPGASFEVRLSQNGRGVWSRSVSGTAFSETGRLDLLVPPSLLDAASSTRIEILLDRPGDPMHGKALYVRNVRTR